MSWEKNQLVNKTSYLKRGISPKYVEGAGYTIINQKCIRDNRIDFTFTKICDSQKTIPEEKILKKGDILINSTGKGTLGRTAQIKNDLEETLLVDTHITIVRAAEDVDPFFLGQLIRRNEIVIEAMGKGSTQQLELSRTDLGELELSFPSLPTQRKIAKILSTYDDLIENNLKRIKLLEEKAFASYKLIVQNEKLEEFTIEELANVVMGQSPTSDTYTNEKEDNLPFHQGVTNFSNYFVEHKIYCKAPIKIAEEGDILFSVRAPVGRINFTSDKICIGRGLCAFRSKKGFQNYFYHQLKEFFLI